MRPARILGIVAALLAILVIAGAAAIYLAVRSSWIEGAVAGELADWLGEPVRIDSLRVGYLPTPWLEAQGLTVGPVAAEPLLALAGARVEVPWRTVLRRSAHVERLVIDRLALNAAIDGEGRDNYSALIARLTGGDDTAPLAWSIGELGVEGGSLRYVDARDGTAVVVSGVGLEATEVAPGVPFEADLRLAVQWDETVLHLGLAGPATLDFENRRYGLAPARWRGWIGAPQLELGGIDWTATVDSVSLDLAAGSLDSAAAARFAAGCRDHRRRLGHRPERDADGAVRAVQRTLFTAQPRVAFRHGVAGHGRSGGALRGPGRGARYGSRGAGDDRCAWTPRSTTAP